MSAASSSPPESGRGDDAAATLHERAETLAGKLSIRPLRPDESAEAVDTIFDLLAEINRLQEALSRV
jgi:hypothetical protein